MLYNNLSLRLLSIVFLLAICTPATANEWELKKESDGIKLYTKSIANSDLKALRAEFDAAGNTAKLAEIIMDINKQKDWVYSTKSSTIVKRISNNELIYYTEKEMPWPASNRDAVVHVKLANDAGNAMTVTVTSVNGYVPAKDGIVRVPSSKVVWRVTPVDANNMHIVYEAQADPGGSIPTWVVNMFLTKGPLESFKKLRAMLNE